MLTIIILAVIGAIIGIIIQSKDYFDEISFYVFSALIGIIIGGFVGFVLALSLPAKTETLVRTYNLESVNDINGVHGEFFLGSGTVKNKFKYVFYYEENGEYRLKQVDTEIASIKYTTGKPVVEKHYQAYTNSIINLFAIDKLKVNYLILVPKGSIVNNYDFDLK